MTRDGTITVSGSPALDYSSVESRTITNTASEGVTVSVAGGDGSADGNDSYEVRRSGLDLQILIDGTVATSVPFADVAGITVTGTGDADTLTVDFGGQAITSVIPGGNLNYDGGAGADALVLSGTPTTNPSAVTHTFDNASDGGIDIDGSVINYTGLAPITDTLVSGTRTMVFNSSSETITISDDGEAGDDESRIDSTAGEQLDFQHPTNALVIRGDGGDDTIDFDGVDSQFPGTISLTVDGEGGTDSVNFNTALTLAGLTVTSDAIAVTDAITSGTGTLAAVSGISFGGGSLDVSGGTVDLTATSGSITGTGDGSPDITAGTINLTVGGAGKDVGTSAANPLEVDADTSLNVTTGGSAGDDVFLEDLSGGLRIGEINAGGGLLGRGPGEGVVKEILPFAHSEPADRVAIEPDLSQCIGGALAQPFIQGTLLDAEQRGAFCMFPPGIECVAAPLRPAHRHFHAGLDLGKGAVGPRALVERHHDVAAKQALDLHAAFGREHVLAAI